MNAAIRLPAEQVYAAELQALARGDDSQKPAGWSLSPKAVLTYLMGGKASDGTLVTPKYVGRRQLMETAVATLATDRALRNVSPPTTRPMTAAARRMMEVRTVTNGAGSGWFGGGGTGELTGFSC